ncbi:glycosyltransferase family 24 protein [Mixia osmundae IAM 14324]|uniref:UDP-glucose:glycoprotein glucosyltransferase n=1 Tax=Mixia osmundae (strain CBS 9802 / IAM 14324 / JCM 22182 / KY 12970) TaxID=764103 RepID=G7E9Q4_MIXOS|nr:glycosyltransferase family 24 protein [Mixia osmundae IAM 14324]KEI40004.1 glycosyltransferase family 24 protein [Mixia osmundae IAM 14324]GAA99373.1 hypothetical protein E5Q_06069 [Mixia osmundae IAM 14324]
MRLTAAVSLVPALLAWHGSATRSPPIKIDLQASWAAAPLVVQILESISLQSNDAFFDLLSDFTTSAQALIESPLAAHLSAKDVYDRSLALIAASPHFKQDGQIQLLKLSLAMREASPAIEALYNVSAGVVANARCASWVQYNDQTACTSKELLTLMASEAAHGASPKLHPFDHVKAQSSTVPTAILYTSLDSDAVYDLHRELLSRAQSGKLQYVVRWIRRRDENARKLRLSGWGASLDIKKSDYLAIDDRLQADNVESNQTNDGSASSDTKDYDKFGNPDESTDELAPLKARQVAHLGLRALQMIKKSQHPLDTSVRLSQDFPKLAYQLATEWEDELDDKLARELSNAQARQIEGGRNAVWINGLLLEETEMDPFRLLKILRRERDTNSRFAARGLTPLQTMSLLAHPALASASAAGSGPAASGLVEASALGAIFDASDRQEDASVILWWNDLEKDRRYRTWGKSLRELLRPTYPGQMNQVARNLINVIFSLDLSLPASHALLSQQIAVYINRGLPVRFGLVPFIPDESSSRRGVALAASQAFWHLVERAGRARALAFHQELAKSSKLTLEVKDLREAYRAAIAGLQASADRPAPVTFDQLDSAGDVPDRLQEQLSVTEKWQTRLGLSDFLPTGSQYGQVFINGGYHLVDEDWRTRFQTAMNIQMQYLQQQVYMRVLDDSADVSVFFYDLDTSYGRRNKYIFPSEERPLRLLEPSQIDALFERAYTRDAFLTRSQNASAASVWVFGDLASKQGEAQAREAIKLIWARRHARICLVHTGQSTPADAELVHRLKLQWNLRVHGKGYDEMLIVELHNEPDKDEVDPNFLPSTSPDSRAFDAASPFAPGELGVVINGRVVGPFEDVGLLSEDLASLIEFEHKTRIQPVVKAIDAIAPGLLTGDSKTIAQTVAALSAYAAHALQPDSEQSMFGPSSKLRSTDYMVLNGSLTSTSSGNPSTAWLHLGAAIDPLSEVGQRWSAIVRELALMPGVSTHVFFNPSRTLAELPLKRFYRFCMSRELAFDSNGAELEPRAEFRGVPSSVLLTFGADVNPAWLAFPKKTVYDLDNIRLSDLPASAKQSGLEATLELESILVQGHARESPGNSAPRGLQLVLGTQGQQATVDTIVMANLGYFQLKANPGAWQLAIRPGSLGEQVYTMETAGNLGWKSPANRDSTISVYTFEGNTVFPRFVYKTGKEGTDLLSDVSAPPPKAKGDGMLGRLKQAVMGGHDAKQSVLAVTETDPTINIFTVASGLLYERMAMLMVISVLRHTKSKCKFWFIQNFLSPSFKAFIPHLAREYGFDYELVTYKWPHWLRAQKEKQRTIWGYKILFLDVLFPLDLHRVIFVDSDQIVRHDLQDLIDMDLKGAPYAYAPMGDDRKEMEGFRFWKSGYWQNHLAGRPYHISALYVVDLDRFRQVAAGDRLRQQYQGLSADPGSLANLDQDLPNNMIHVIPIHTLDQSWLWCETWCSDESLKDAKTIDLCNNPMTHEPKLARARRLIPEWNVYDAEVAALAKRVAATADPAEAQAFAVDAGGLEQAKLQQKEYVDEGTAGDAPVDGATTPDEHRKDEL